MEVSLVTRRMKYIVADSAYSRVVCAVLAVPQKVKSCTAIKSPAKYERPVHKSSRQLIRANIDYEQRNCLLVNDSPSELTIWISVL